MDVALEWIIHLIPVMVWVVSKYAVFSGITDQDFAEQIKKRT